jgi:type VI protein secretion system component VasK
MRNEENFYRELAEVPPVPADLFEKINSKISRKSRINKSIIALAACTILALGTTLFLRNQSQTAEYSADVANELQIIHDYVNGEDLEQDLNSYVAVDYNE